MTAREHWYRVTVTECVNCGASDRVRERMYTRKPASAAKRLIFLPCLCGRCSVSP